MMLKSILSFIAPIGFLRLYCCDGGDTPQPDPAQAAALMKQAATADKMLDFVMKSYEDNKPVQAEAAALNKRSTEQLLDLSSKAGARADDAYSFYQKTGRPVVEQALGDAKGWDSAENVGKARDQARADVQASADNTQAQSTRNLQRMGINPNSGKMAAINSQMQLQQTALMAGGMNQAGDNRATQAVQMRQGASNIAQGLPTQSMSFAGQSGGFQGAGNAIGQQTLATAQGAQGAAANGMAGAAGIYGSNAGGYGNMYNSQLKAREINTQSNDNMWGGIGKLAGTAATLMFADGGQIDGPGTGTSDSVPAVNGGNGHPIALSNGEYIISADVVRAKGKEFFDKLQSKYHQPTGRSNIGRAAT